MDLDWTTVILEILNFGVLALLLARFLFKPVRKVLAERKHEVERAQAEAQAARAESQTAKAEFERRRVELDKQAEAALEQAKIEGQQAAQQIVEAAREHAHHARASLDAELERARDDALEQLRPELVELAYEAGRRVLLDIQMGDVTLAFARQAARRLHEELDPDASTRSRVQAHVSPDADRDAISLVLKESLGDVHVEIEVDASMVGGVRLVADGLEVEASAGASLARWFEHRAQHRAWIGPGSGVPVDG
jgi:F-type H+-transporting ATPase subunit b